MEHRWGARVEVDYPIRVRTLRFSMKAGRLADMSVSGARVEAPFTTRVLSRIQVAIVLPRWHGHLHPFIDAYVARLYDEGFGIEGCDFAPPAIVELLRSNAARPHAPGHRHPESFGDTSGLLVANGR